MQESSPFQTSQPDDLSTFHKTPSHHRIDSYIHNTDCSLSAANFVAGRLKKSTLQKSCNLSHYSFVLTSLPRSHHVLHCLAILVGMTVCFY